MPSSPDDPATRSDDGRPQWSGMLRQQRLAQRLSTDDAAALMKVAQNTWSGLENGTRKMRGHTVRFEPSVVVLRDAAEALHMTAEQTEALVAAGKAMRFDMAAASPGQRLLRERREAAGISVSAAASMVSLSERGYLRWETRPQTKNRAASHNLYNLLQLTHDEVSAVEQPLPPAQKKLVKSAPVHPYQKLASTLRIRAGLTMRQAAALSNVSFKTVLAWELRHCFETDAIISESKKQHVDNLRAVISGKLTPATRAPAATGKVRAFIVRDTTNFPEWQVRVLAWLQRSGITRVNAAHLTGAPKNRFVEWSRQKCNWTDKHVAALELLIPYLGADATWMREYIDTHPVIPGSPGVRHLICQVTPSPKAASWQRALCALRVAANMTTDDARHAMRWRESTYRTFERASRRVPKRGTVEAFLYAFGATDAESDHVISLIPRLNRNQAPSWVVVRSGAENVVGSDPIMKTSQ